MYYTSFMAIYTIRLDEESEQVLARAAADRGVSRASILREAVSEYGKRAGRAVDYGKAFEPLIGTVTNGPKDLSEQTGVRFTEELLKARASSSRRRSAKVPRRK